MTCRFNTPAPKVYTDGTARTRTPPQTLALLEPVLERFGVTRLANITGLDRVGIPVYQATRPNARSLSVSQGKGLDAASAKVSALMESLEGHHAEHARCLVRLETHQELARQARVADPERLFMARNSRFHPGSTLPWTEGRDIRTDEPVFVPFELVHANATVPRVPGSGAFAPGTNGLASGNHMAEAALHGLCELVERDAAVLWHIGGEKSLADTRVVLDSVETPACRRLIERFRDAEVDVMVWDMTSDVGVACFRAVIFDPQADADLYPCPAAHGSGCHPDRGIALSRALTEAAQSRLTLIAGSRDDLIGRYREVQSPESLNHHRRLSREPAVRRFEAAPNSVGASLDDDLDHVMDLLSERGMPEAIVVDLSSPGLDLAFARVIVPGLEMSIDSPSFRPGARARARLG